MRWPTSKAVSVGDADSMTISPNSSAWWARACPSLTSSSRASSVTTHSARTRSRLSRSSLETLAIIAYRQPVSRPDIDGVRGVNSEAVLDNLLDRRMVKIAGRKDSPGRPFLYETTRDFLVAFGLRDLADLPKVEGDLVIPETPPDAAGAAGSGEGVGISPATDAAQQDPGPGGAGVTPRG